VERESFRGARVRAISDAEAVGNLEARAVLDGLAVRHAAGNATGADAARLRATLAQTRRTFRAGDLPEMFELKAHLNRQVLGIASHRTATRLVDALQAQSVRSQYRTVLVPGRAEQSLAEHRAIVAAVEAGRADEAEERMRAHLSRVVGALRQAQRSRQAARSSV
jgi:DNA-binding GntR family transcriptional regulator